VLAALDFAPTGIDALVQRTGIAAADLLAALTMLEIERQVATLPGGLWQRLA
jgi:DNA processing protein